MAIFLQILGVFTLAVVGVSCSYLIFVKVHQFIQSYKKMQEDIKYLQHSLESLYRIRTNSPQDTDRVWNKE